MKYAVINNIASILCQPSALVNILFYRYFYSALNVFMLESIKVFFIHLFWNQEVPLADFQAVIQRLTAGIESNIQKLNFPGLAIGVTSRERVLFLGGFGLANLETQQIVTPQTLFQIGSISKSFTSIVLLQLQEQGLINLDSPISQYLPWFKIQTDFAPILIKNLMNHTAGIIMGSDSTPSAYTEVWDLRHTKATAPPGELFHYSNSGYKILGLVLQAVLRKNLAQILKERVFSPLGMNETEPVISNAIRSRLAVGYEAFYDDKPLPFNGELVPATWFESDTADGSISSTSEDMCRYLRVLLNRGQSLLHPDSFNKLIQPLIPTGDSLHGEMYGLGLNIRQIDGHQVIGHSGGMVGYTTDLLADLDAGLGVVVLTNGLGNPEIISQYALKLFLSATESNLFPEPRFTDPYKVENPNEYLGRYSCGNKTFIISLKEHTLYLDFEGESILLEPKEKDTFLIPHPSWDMFLLRFGRGSNQSSPPGSQIIEAFHGPDWYINACYQGETSYEVPLEWFSYTGHYRSHNPWLTNFRVVVQKNTLVLIQQWDSSEPLHQIASARFRVGSESLSPEFIEFDMILNGKAMRANLSGGAYSRTFSP